MDGSFTIQISSNLVKKLVDDGEKVKRKTRKPKPKAPQQVQQSPPYPKQLLDNELSPSIELPKQPPFYLPPQKSATPTRFYEDGSNALEERLERLKKQEENMLEEVTRRAKDLHDKEFKLPKGGPMPCVDQKDACLECYKEHVKDPLKCAQLVKEFADCARTVRQQVSMDTN